MSGVDVEALRALLAEFDVKTDGDFIERFANGQRIAMACADYLRVHGPAIIAQSAAYDALVAAIAKAPVETVASVEGADERDWLLVYLGRESESPLKSGQRVRLLLVQEGGNA